MGCCARREPKTDDAAGDIRSRKRGCTDLPCLLLLFACLAPVGYACYLGAIYGDPFRIIYGVDSWGNTCGRLNRDAWPNYTLTPQDLTGLNNLFVANVADVENSLKICVNQCPNETLSDASALRDYAQQTGTKLCRYDVSPLNYTLADGDVCPTVVVPTSPVLSRCVPDLAVSGAVSVLSGAMNGALHALKAQCDSEGTFFEKLISDASIAWREIVYLCLIALALALLLTILMRWLAGVIIISSVVLTVLGAAGGAGYLWWRWYEDWSTLQVVEESQRIDSDVTTVRNDLIYASCASGAFLIVLLVVLILRKRIMLVVQLFREAGRAVGAMPVLLLQPLWTLLALVLVGGCAVLGAGYVESGAVGTARTDHASWVRLAMHPHLLHLRWVYAFVALWLVQFVLACHHLVIAGSVVGWYFTRDKQHDLGWPVARAHRLLLRYYLGTAAFGSLVIAIVQTIRIVLAYVEKKTRHIENPTLKIMFKCVQCCLWCFEKALKFLSRSAYVMTMLQGTGFCTSARDAFMLLLRNCLRVAAVNSVGTFCLFLGKAAIVVSVVFIGMELLSVQPLCYPWAPVAAAACGAYLVAHVLLSLYSALVDAVLLCFCRDVEENDGDVKPFYMSKGLMQYVQATNQRGEEKDARRAARRAEKERKKAQRNVLVPTTDTMPSVEW